MTTLIGIKMAMIPRNCSSEFRIQKNTEFRSQTKQTCTRDVLDFPEIKIRQNDNGNILTLT